MEFINETHKILANNLNGQAEYGKLKCVIIGGNIIGQGLVLLFEDKMQITITPSDYKYLNIIS